MRKPILATFVIRILITSVFLFSAPLIAQEADAKVLLNKIAVLEARVMQLEEKLEMKEHLVPMKEISRTEGTPPESEGLVKTLEDIHLGGYVSTAYNFNTRNPLPGASSGPGPATGTANASGNNTNIRVFDRDANSFMNNAVFMMEKPAVEKGKAGFRTDVMLGRDAQILSSGNVGESTDNIAVPQAYVNYVIPFGNGIEIKAGRFFTIAGLEGTYSKDNWNSSRGLLYAFLPISHNGLLGSYEFCKYVGVKLGVVNGWDAMVDNNRGKTLLSSLALHPVPGLDFTNNFLFGPEQARTAGGLNTDSDNRGLWDSVLMWTPIKDFDAWKLAANFDYGWEENAPGKLSSGNAIWHGLGLGTKYDVNDWLTLAGRWEYFSDPDGVRIASLNGLTPVSQNTLYEMTYTADVKLTKNLLTRLEYRYDQSQAQIFDLSNNIAGGDGAAQNQHTLGAEMIYAF